MMHNPNQGYGYGHPQIPDSNPTCRQIAFQPPQFSVQMMPPYNVGEYLPHGLKPHVPAVALAVAQDLVRQSPINPAFIYLFNLVAVNQFRGDEWFRMVEFATLLLGRYVETRHGANLQSLIQEAAYNAVTLKASYYAGQNNAVMQSLDHQTRNDVQTMTMEHNQLGQLFIQMINQHQQQMQVATNPQAAQQAYGGLVGNTMAGRVMANQGGYYQGPLPTMASGFVRETANETAMTAYGATRGPAPETVRAAPKRRRGVLEDDYVPEPEDVAYRAMPAQTSAQVTAPAWAQEPTLGNTNNSASLTPAPAADFGSVTHFGGTAEPVTKTIQEPVYLDESAWRPTIAQPYRPAIYNVESKLVYEVLPTRHGDVVFATAVEKSEEEMERQQYAIPGYNQNIQDNLNRKHDAPTGAIMMNDMDLIARGLRHIAVREDPEHIDKFTKMGIGEGDVEDLGATWSMNQAVSLARRKRLQAGESDEVIFCSQVELVDEFTATSSIEALTNRLANAGAFSQLATMLSTMIDDASEDNGALTALHHIDEMFTKEFNLLMQVGLGLESARVDSFRKDAAQMMALIEEGYGPMYVKEMSNIANAYIKAFFDTLVFDEVKAQTEYEDEKSEYTVGSTMTRMESVTLTLVDLDSMDLAMSLEKGQVREIFSTNFPGFQPFIETIVDKFPRSKNYLVTTDGAMFGIARSILTEKSTVIYSPN